VQKIPNQGIDRRDHDFVVTDRAQPVENQKLRRQVLSAAEVAKNAQVNDWQVSKLLASIFCMEFDSAVPILRLQMIDVDTRARLICDRGLCVTEIVENAYVYD